jgi:2TM domain
MGAEVLKQVLADPKSAPLLYTGVMLVEDRGRFTRSDWFSAHIVVFAIGAWNLFAIDWAHDPHGWWFWMPVAAWFAVLVLHGGWLSFAEHRRGRGLPRRLSSDAGKVNDEGRAHADRALDFHAASVALGNVADDAQA